MQSVDTLLRAAVADRRLVSFTLHGRPRVGGWRRALITEISQLLVLEQRFTGARPTSSDRHVEWDELFATIHPRE